MAVREELVDAKKAALLDIDRNRMTSIGYYGYHESKEDTYYDTWQ